MRSNTSSLIRPINQAAILMHEEAEPLPSMFRRPQASAEIKPRGSNGKARFSPFIIALVMLAFAPAQAALLTSSIPINGEEAIEKTLVLVKQGAAGIASLVLSAAMRDAYSAGEMD